MSVVAISGLVSLTGSSLASPFMHTFCEGLWWTSTLFGIGAVPAPLGPPFLLTFSSDSNQVPTRQVGPRKEATRQTISFPVQSERTGSIRLGACKLGMEPRQRSSNGGPKEKDKTKRMMIDTYPENRRLCVHLCRQLWKPLWRTEGDGFSWGWSVVQGAQGAPGVVRMAKCREHTSL